MEAVHREPESIERVSERFVTRASELGFPVPPMALRLKLVESAQYSSLFLQPLIAGPTHGIAEWIERFLPLRLEFGSRNVIRADFQTLPLVWSVAFRGVEIDTLILDTNGQAQISVSGTRSALRAFTGRVRGPVAALDLHRVGTAIAHPRLLTLPQEEALRVAVEAGYYDIPRPLNLRELAKRLDISSASLSERLRRAEGRVVTLYVKHGGRTPWDEKTLFDARPFVPDQALWPHVVEPRPLAQARAQDR